MAPQARYWLLTINDSDTGESWQVPNELPGGVVWLRGQKESAPTTGREHWQLFVAFSSKVRLGRVKQCFGARVHAEPSRSEAAENYVFKV